MRRRSRIEGLLGLASLGLVCLVLANLVLASARVEAGEIRFATFNIESDASTDDARIAETIRALGPLDMLALQEVAGPNAVRNATAALRSATRGRYRYVISESGAAVRGRLGDRLAIIYDSARFRQMETIELHVIRSVPDGSAHGRPNWGLRAALFLRLRAFDDDIEFLFGTVHLKCCSAGGAVRAHQARLLAEWIARADVPVILAGDFNIPVLPQEANGASASAAFDRLVDALAWVRPANPTKTQCSPDHESMLDHVFVDRERIAMAEVRIHETDPAYCAADRRGGSDHRPVSARVSIE
ncbi:MAG: endonuclease/exonuclease/phosphatase family protein [Alphaproteobacteria bacterium]|nr:endonuclease/exonuclease/phosphatase family protein [Alphaproteobacteria bacterium]